MTSSYSSSDASDSCPAEVGLQGWEGELCGRFQGGVEGENRGLEIDQRQTSWFGHWTSYLAFLYLH